MKALHTHTNVSISNLDYINGIYHHLTKEMGLECKYARNLIKIAEYFINACYLRDETIEECSNKILSYYKQITK